MEDFLLNLAQRVAQFLLPLLPYLLKMGERAAEEMSRKIGDEVWDKAKTLWDSLGRKDRVKSAAESAATLSDNPAARQAFVEEILRALKEDPALRGETTRIVSELQVEVVRKGGEVIGVRVATPRGPLFIESTVTAKDVYGNVIGVTYEG